MCKEQKGKNRMKNAILKAEGLCKSFAHNGVQNHVLDKVNAEIYEGDFTIIMGASGAGKSTLLYSLSGMDSITAGKVFYKGKDFSNLSEKEMAPYRAGDFGFVFQQSQLVSNLTLLENVAVTGYLNKKYSSAETKRRAIELLTKMNLEKAINRYPSQVSGGEAQRAAIARAMLKEPGILFADEPTGALNKRNTTDVLNLLTELNRAGQSILMVTHDIRAAIRATRLLYLEDGRIIGEMELPPYEEADAKNREAQTNAWLTSMAW